MQNAKGATPTIKEADIYNNIVKYLAVVHPKVIYRFDFAAGMKMTKGQAMKHKALNNVRGYPDLFICEPRGEYAGLFLEIKRSGQSPYLKTGGGLRQDEHVLEQADVLMRLRKRGYYAEFAVGFDECMQKIDAYLKLKL
jgi:hypothetical protein